MRKHQIKIRQQEKEISWEEKRSINFDVIQKEKNYWKYEYELVKSRK